MSGSTEMRWRKSGTVDMSVLTDQRRVARNMRPVCNTRLLLQPQPLTDGSLMQLGSGTTATLLLLCSLTTLHQRTACLLSHPPVQTKWSSSCWLRCGCVDCVCKWIIGPLVCRRRAKYSRKAAASQHNHLSMWLLLLSTC